ncbi:hypothetical protein ACFVVX_22705 [Kitasatospora sp. NPDC058170]|uniref:hypothetical protein n=1 Tax=Kitasatospora sp. NPDC058170 TaxID=3346364 RepID=UPI0036DD3E41
MTAQPARPGPPLSEDVVLTALLLPLLAALPVGLLALVASIAWNTSGQAQGTVVGIGLAIGPPLCLGAAGLVVRRSWRSGYRILPIAAGVAPFLPLLWAFAGFPGV